MTHFLIFLLSSFLFLLVQYGRAQQTFFPAAIPLAVRSPYLSCWQFTTNGSTIGSLRPTTSAHQPNSTQDPSLDSLNMVVLVRVDNITYLFLGYANTVNATVNFTNTVISPTKTKLTAQAGPMQFDLTFLNPIEPGDLIKQSIPFSYLSLTARSLDGAAHAVQVHSHLSAEWMSANRSHVILWNTTTTSNVIYHSVTLQNPSVFKEIATQPEWGTLYYAMKNGGKVTYKIAEDSVVLESFRLGGVLDNKTDTEFRPISDRLSVFGISRDLGTTYGTQDPIVWTIGFVTDPAIQYTDTSGGTTEHRLLYKSKSDYPDDMSLIVKFLDDFTYALARSQELDRRILKNASAISSQLGDLVSLATAQVYGSIQLTDMSDSPSSASPMAFMKNIGGSKTNRVNAVETLYSAFPALMFIDPILGGLLLDSLFRLRVSNIIPFQVSNIPYAAPDLGMNYPKVTVGNPVDDQGIEHSGNMLIMTFAHARANGSGDLIDTYYTQLTSWADYLLDSTLLLINQTSAGDAPTNDQYNLAIKGIIAIKAMSNMSLVVGEGDDANKYSSAAVDLYTRWKDVALDGFNDQHIRAAYGPAESWTLGYNLFADVWLGTSVVGPSVYQDQSTFVNSLLVGSTFSNFGMSVNSLDSNQNVVVSSWNMFVAAMTSDPELSTNIISRVHNRASYNASAGVFPLTYDSFSGSTIMGVASPAQGAMYAPLVLKVSPIPILAHPLTTPSKPSNAVVFFSVIGTFVLAIWVLVLVVWCRRGQSRESESVEFSSPGGMIMDLGPHIAVTPFDLMDPTLAGETPLGAGSQTDQQRRVVSVPVGLSSKELAELRSRSQPTDEQSLTPFNLTRPTLTVAAPLDEVSQADERQPVASIPVSLSSEEPAELLLRSKPAREESPNPFPTAPIDGGAAVSSPRAEAQRLYWQPEADYLWGDVRQPRATGSEAPPSYDSEAGDWLGRVSSRVPQPESELWEA